MKQAAAKRRVTTTAQDDVERYAAVVSAKQQFITAAFDMGWRLALMVIIPIFIGVKLDDRYDTSPSWTLAALFVAVFGAGLIVYKTVSDVNRAQKAKGGKKG